MIHTKDVIAKLIKKSAWQDGQFPGEKKVAYRTRQIIFEVENKENDTKEYIRINVKDNNVASMEYNKLKIDDKIKGFKMLLDDQPIINPSSTFEKHYDGALF